MPSFNRTGSRSRAERASCQASIHHPRNRGCHSNPTERTNRLRNLRVMVENAQLAEQVFPVMYHVFGIANREKRQLLRTGIGHVRRYRKKLLEEKEGAECSPLYLTTKNEINRQQERNPCLRDRTTGDV